MRLGSFRWAPDALGKRLSIFDAAFAAVTARRLGPDARSAKLVTRPIGQMRKPGKLPGFFVGSLLWPPSFRSDWPFASLIPILKQSLATALGRRWLRDRLCSRL